METRSQILEVMLERCIAELKDAELDLRNMFENIKARNAENVEVIPPVSNRGMQSQCPKCGKEKSGKATYCPKCAPRYCITCGATKSNKQPYCTKCANARKAASKTKKKKMAIREQPYELRP